METILSKQGRSSAFLQHEVYELKMTCRDVRAPQDFVTMRMAGFRTGERWTQTKTCHQPHGRFMPQKIIYGLIFIALGYWFYYFFYQDLFDYITEPDNQISILQELGITRSKHK